MLEKFKENIKKLNLINSSDTILIAASGGIDSMVLTHLLLQAGYKCALVHCNFLLRGAESDGDEAFILSEAKRLGIPLFLNKCNALSQVQTEGISVEMAARALRYDWFDKLMQSGNFNKLATGHHLNDDQETFFIKLFRGSGLSGIKGIPVQRDYIIRPLMFFTREEIEVYAKENHILFREDSSNSGDAFLRNRIRHHLLPYMENEFPGSRKALNSSIEKLKEEEELFSTMVGEKRKTLILSDGIEIKIDKEELNKIPEPLFYYILEPYGFTRDQSNKILQTSGSEQTGQFFNSFKYTLLNDREYLFIRARQDTEIQSFKIDSFINAPENPIHLEFELIERTSDFNFESNPNTAYFDVEKLELPLTLRHWQNADSFIPFGMKGKKLLSDFFIDQKVNRFDKEKIWLLISGETIIWVVGLRSSDNFRVQNKTEKILKITYIKK
ncbi:MAG: tRNA lysidine(34) synthetase TilS [Bacteroidales bacterium]|nr:tRNA lysidine(34) synthetase TilS [Bacteroidales bacterium]